MGPSELDQWLERCRHEPLVAAVGEELTLEQPRHVCRVTRAWLTFGSVEPLALGLDPATGALRWDPSDPHEFQVPGMLRTRIIDISRRAGLADVLGMSLTDWSLVRFAHDERPCGVELELGGFLGLLLFVWGDAIEAWSTAEFDELERQGFALERV